MANMVEASTLVRCTRECCKGKDTMVRFVDRYVIRKPNPYDKAYRALSCVRVFYCARCNNLLNETELPTNADVAGLPPRAAQRVR